MSDDPKKDEAAEAMAEFRIEQVAIAKCLANASLLMSGNALKAALSLMAAAQAMHAQALKDCSDDQSIFKAYDALHAYEVARGQHATVNILAACGITYTPTVADASAEPPPLDPALVN
jgi:hypothetical protein